MRIALCYTGYLRTWESCRHNHYDNILKPNGLIYVDRFFYTYECPKEHRLYYAGDLMVPDSKWIECPHPFYDDPFATHKWDANKAGETKVHQVLNMMHNNIVGFSLIQKGYDIYVRIRCDLKFNGPLNFSDYDIQPNTIYIPKGNDYRGISDQFAFGDYDSMRKYYSVYLNCPDLCADGVLFNSEVLHLANLNKLGVNIFRLEHPQHDIVR